MSMTENILWTWLLAFINRLSFSCFSTGFLRLRITIILSWSYAYFSLTSLEFFVLQVFWQFGHCCIVETPDAPPDLFGRHKSLKPENHKPNVRRRIHFQFAWIIKDQDSLHLVSFFLRMLIFSGGSQLFSSCFYLFFFTLQTSNLPKDYEMWKLAFWLIQPHLWLCFILEKQSE